MKESIITVLMVEPEKTAYAYKLENKLEAFQVAVGGLIETTSVQEENLVAVCNEEGKAENLPFNRVLTDENNVPYDVIAGTFFVAGIDDEGNFRSLTLKELKTMKKRFMQPETFYYIEPLDQVIISRGPLKVYPPLYLKSYAHASKAGEDEICFASTRENLKCKAAIKEALHQISKDTSSMDSAIASVLDEYGLERVIYVLAYTVRKSANRISAEQLAWAKTVQLQDDVDDLVSSKRLVIDVDPAQLEAFIEALRFREVL